MAGRHFAAHQPKVPAREVTAGALHLPRYIYFATRSWVIWVPI
jgi:hypothetical protein